MRSKKNVLLLIISGLAALILVECGHFGVSTLLWPLLAMIAMIPVSQECNFLQGLLVYAAVSICTLLLPITESAFIFLLMGYYPIIRTRINNLNIRTIKVGVRILLIVAVSTLMFAIVKIFYGNELSAMVGASDVAILIAFIVAGAIFFILYEFIIDRCTKFYNNNLSDKFQSL